ncbi:unnamed protein product [Adineta ricciae]|uniref:G-protein coupled receptors family 1 profile domain-containing protein n=1 Tax=Adineta ricciae TaxID=249248 RepID=A0A815HRC6_ADIRI|nr:unnamed protein product [Adineta ricciae]CAF1357555.1 unnamed protein product [Adineta ricciae]
MLFFNLIYLTIGISLVLMFMKEGVYMPSTPALCLTHQMVDRGVWYGAVFTMIWLCIERHILIFCSNWIRTARGQWVFHYIPLAIFSLYAPCFYFYMIFIYPCEHIYDYHVTLCGGPWYSCSLSASFRLYLTFGHNFMPFPIIFIVSSSFLLRVLIQKHRLKRGNMWKKNRKMILQFVFISTTYISFALPFTMVNITRRVNGYDVDPNVRTLFDRMANVPAIVLPYATAITLPHVKQKLKMLIWWKRTRTAINPLS